MEGDAYPSAPKHRSDLQDEARGQQTEKTHNNSGAIGMGTDEVGYSAVGNRAGIGRAGQELGRHGERMALQLGAVA